MLLEAHLYGITQMMAGRYYTHLTLLEKEELAFRKELTKILKIELEKSNEIL
jgi:hypothetical protein